MLQGSHWSLETSEGAIGSGHQEAPLHGNTQTCPLRARPSPKITPAPGASSALASRGDPKLFGSVLVPASARPARLRWGGVLLQFWPAGKLQVKFVNYYSKTPQKWVPEECSWPAVLIRETELTTGAAGLLLKLFLAGWTTHSHHRPGAPWLFCFPGQGASVSPGPPALRTPHPPLAACGQNSGDEGQKTKKHPQFFSAVFGFYRASTKHAARKKNLKTVLFKGQ